MVYVVATITHVIITVVLYAAELRDNIQLSC